MGPLSIFPAMFFATMCSGPINERNDRITKYDGRHMEVREEDSIELYWDNVSADSGRIVRYELLYHTEKDSTWRRIGEKSSDSTESGIVVHRKDIDVKDSIFFFGVRYETRDTLMSEICSSMDSAAIPAGGWFLLWKKCP